MTLDQIIKDMENEIAGRRLALSGPKGMSVPHLGLLASATPSTLKALEWWIARLKEIK